jgi:hypothetical protein
VEEVGSLHAAVGNGKWHSHYGKVWQFLKKFNIVLPNDPIILLLDIHPREMKTYSHTKC